MCVCVLCDFVSKDRLVDLKLLSSSFEILTVPAGISNVIYYPIKKLGVAHSCCLLHYSHFLICYTFHYEHDEATLENYCLQMASLGRT